MLKRVKIKNFKSIRSLDLEMPNFAAIVGNNSVGKSNFLMAINLMSLLAKGFSFRGAAEELLLLTTEIVFNNEIDTFSIEFEIEIESQKFNYYIEFKKKAKNETTDFIIYKEVLSNGKEIISRKGDKSGVFYNEELHQKLEIVNNQSLLSILEKPESVSKVKKFISSIKVDKFSPIDLKYPGNTSNVISGRERHLVEKFYSLRKYNSSLYKEIEKEAKEIITGLEEISVDEFESQIILYLKEYGLNKKQTSFSSSDGTLRSLNLLFSILGDPKPPVVFIDEIENSMHPKRITSLMKFFNYLSEKEKDKIQIIFTTHSPVVLDNVSEKEIIYMFKKDLETIFSMPYRDDRVFNYISKLKDKEASMGDLYKNGILEDIFREAIKNK